MVYPGQAVCWWGSDGMEIIPADAMASMARMGHRRCSKEGTKATCRGRWKIRRKTKSGPGGARGWGDHGDEPVGGRSLGVAISTHVFFCAERSPSKKSVLLESKWRLLS